MRKGMNPAKENPRLEGGPRHRIIIPVYIPALDGYFSDSLEILKLCLESLHITTSGKVSITVVSNNSVEEVVEELKRHYRDGWIDQLLLNRSNRGKIDAVVSVARGAFEELITISDCDVLFKANWLEAIEEIFQRFPECGFASPVPNPTLMWYCNLATFLGGMARRELRFEKVVPEEDLDRFAYSIGRSDLYKPEHRRTQLIAKRNGLTACLGCGHFVCTMRKEVLAAMPKYPSLSAIEGNSELFWLDIPPDKLGLWRLATTRAYAYHMGNVVEPWMYDELEKCHRRAAEPTAQLNELPAVRRSWISRMPWRLRNKLMQGMKRFHLRELIFRRLGYPTSE